LIEDNWVESKYDWINALIVLNRKLGDEIKIFLTISVESDIRNTSRNIIQVNFNSHVVLNTGNTYLTHFPKD
jgi:hypothetical protein